MWQPTNGRNNVNNGCAKHLHFFTQANEDYTARLFLCGYIQCTLYIQEVYMLHKYLKNYYCIRKQKTKERNTTRRKKRENYYREIVRTHTGKLYAVYTRKN